VPYRTTKKFSKWWHVLCCMSLEMLFYVKCSVLSNKFHYVTLNITSRETNFIMFCRVLMIEKRKIPCIFLGRPTCFYTWVSFYLVLNSTKIGLDDSDEKSVHANDGASDALLTRNTRQSVSPVVFNAFCSSATIDRKSSRAYIQNKSGL